MKKKLKKMLRKTKLGKILYKKIQIKNRKKTEPKHCKRNGS